MSGQIKGSSTPVSQPLGLVAWDFRDGKIRKVRFFPTWDAALEAAHGYPNSPTDSSASDGSS
jgi:hypothetical protein